MHRVNGAYDKQRSCAPLRFIQRNDKDASILIQELLKQLEKNKMNLQDCRSQCYDNVDPPTGTSSYRNDPPTGTSGFSQRNRPV